MLEFLLAALAAVRVFLRIRQDTALEILALRQQLAVLKRKRPRPRLNPLDRLFWTALRRFWSRWAEVLIVVKPQTVVGWHRAGFRLFWKWQSRPRGGRPKSTAEIRALIRRLTRENPSWGAPKIHGELQKLGSSSPNEPWLATCAVSGAAVMQATPGAPSWRITARRSSRSTSSPCRQ